MPTHQFRRILSATLLCIIASCNHSAPAQEVVAPVRQAIDIQVLHAPAAVRMGGVLQWLYEVHITNFASSPLHIARLQVLSNSGSEVVTNLTGIDLGAAVSIVGASAAEQAQDVIAPGRRAVVYLAVPGRVGGINTLTHRISLSASEDLREPFTVSGGDVTISNAAVPLLGPPLRGGPWSAVYAPELERGHRRVIYAVGGRARIPGRYAVDWMVSGPSETSSALNPWSKDDGKGAPVLAVADGRVVAARDGIPEPVAGASRPRTLTDAAGNYIALDIGQGRFAMYEHLAPGLAVAVGQQVLRGDVIATLGSTGQASRPHLHFHVSDAPSPIAAEGQPFEMNGWRQIGRHASIQAFDRGDPWMGSILSSADQSEQGFPGPNAVLMFD